MTSKVSLSERMSILLPFAYVMDMMHAPILTYYAFYENFVDALFHCYRRERVRIRSLVGDANLVGTIICVGGAMLGTLCKEITINLWSCKDNVSSDDSQSVSGILMKGSLLLGAMVQQGAIVLVFILKCGGRPQLRNSRRAYAFIMFLLLFIMNAFVSSAAFNDYEAGVPVGDKLPPDCQYVAQCGLCLRCYRSGRGFQCCD